MTVATPSVADQPWFQAPALRRVFALLNAEGGEVRVVGGAVRNALMGADVDEVDLATTLTPDAVTARAEAAGIKAVPTGIAHGTVTLVVDGVPFEVTTLRRDVATDGRHAEVAFGTDWAVDAARRDLTMNALYATESGEVIDLVGGIADIEKGMVRFIGPAADRVAEDYLRILRFFRFFAWYGAFRPDADGLRASAQAKGKISTLSAERIWAELKKLLSARDPGRALLWMRTSGVLTEILPESEKWGIDAIPGLVAAEQALGWSADPLLRLAAMVPPDPDRLDAMASRLRLSKAESAVMQAFAKAGAIKDTIAETALDRLLYREGRNGVVFRLKLALASVRQKVEADGDAMAANARLGRLLDRALAWQKPVFPVSGGDLIASGMSPGPAMGAKLGELEESWIASGFRESRDSLLAQLAAD
ncbi:poly(A) polymerase [Rhizobium sp. Leaf384]|uniref:CCA tRNA nucleotidyltransferase n=1 Tax=unclassified Rhizobium TaxID=2613769 RepID=UPI0007152C17|nr:MULTISPECIES: CCA tRNA nucleotidyltransferase [unclassified Rhizobium]KQS76908.1 poly(A) polymerase [Rhizobium sp. Leaf384]KQS78179.1 poly(A) polymerase [Rhizobium sp. Leaf383]